MCLPEVRRVAGRNPDADGKDVGRVHVKQAAQHGAGALWILAAEQEAKQAINEHQDARRLLASLLTGKMGKKAEGNAAGALLALGHGLAPQFYVRRADPVSVLAAVSLM